MTSNIPIEIHVTDIILFDIVGYSCLSDEDQYLSIYFISKKLNEFLGILFGQSFTKTEEAVLGFIPTGDGAYIILNHKLAGYGLFMAISLRSSLLQLKNQTNALFSGLRTAVHNGTVIPIQDITNNQNFVGSGLNDCSRLYCIDKEIIGKQNHLIDDNYIVVSSNALSNFHKTYPSEVTKEFLGTIKFEVGEEIIFQDKHKKEHKAHFVECNRHVAVTPPKPVDGTENIDTIYAKYKG